MASQLVTTGVKYPSKEDVEELTGLFGNWLKGRAVTNTDAFGFLVSRLDEDPLFYGVSYAITALNKLAEELNSVSSDQSDVVEQLQEEREKRLKRLSKIRETLEALEEGQQTHPPEFFERQQAAAKQASAALKKRYKDTLKQLRKLRYKAGERYGESSREYYEADRDYREVKSRINGPKVQYALRYEGLQQEMSKEREHMGQLLRQADKLRDSIASLDTAIDEVISKHKLAAAAAEEKLTNDFYEAWTEAFRTFARATRWDRSIVERFEDPTAVNKDTFTADLTRAVKATYKADMIRSQAELDADVATRDALRAVCKANGEKLFIDPTIIDPRSPHQEKVDQLLGAAEATVQAFSEVPLFELRTQVDFRRKQANFSAGTFVTSRKVMPRIGYFQFKLAAPDAYRAYEDFLVKFRPIDAGMRSQMIDSLVELSHTFNEHDKRIKSVNDVSKTAMYADQAFTSQEAISTSVMQAVIKVAISQLEREEPDIDSYAKSFIDESVPGYTGGSAAELRCVFYNPFNIAPVYYIFGLAGATHKAVDKTYYWIRLLNTACEDMDCIPCALAIKQPGLAVVPDEQVAAVRRMITSMSANELADTVQAYRSILAPVKAPWVIIKTVSQSGSWVVHKWSDDSLAQITPLELKARLGEVVALHVKQGHITRIVGFTDYDGAGWSYDLDSFAVIAKTNANTGMGCSVTKLLRGNAHLAESGACCIGERTYAKLTQLKQPTATEVLHYLVTRDLIPELVHDSLEMAETMQMPLGPGEVNGEYYDEVPITKLNEADCIAMATAEWDARRCVIKDGAFAVWNMLRLPRWIIVSRLNKEDQTWVVDDASDYTLKECQPSDAVKMMGNLIVFAKRTPKDGSKQSTLLYRVIDYFVGLPADDGSSNTYSGRHNLVVMANSQGLVNTIRLNRPLTETGDELISAEELQNADAEDSVEKQLACFKGVRYVVVTDLKLSKDGRIKTFESAARSGKVTASDLADGAPDLLRVWQDPNKMSWLIIDTRWYDIQRAIKGTYDELPVAYIGADYETLNKGSDTTPVLLSWARLNGASAAMTSGCFKGTQCTRMFTAMLADIAIKEGCRIVVITFHGAFFDLHMMLEGIATWGNFGQLETDRVVVVGNKLLEINWLRKVKFMDLRRFTQSSLACICEAFHVSNPKSDIDLKLVQELYDECNCNLDAFWIRLRRMRSSELVINVDADRQCPGFQEKIAKLDGEQAYIEYCINDSIATVQCYMKVKMACGEAVKAMDLPAEQRESIASRYNIDEYCTIPAMAYKCYRAGLPIVDGVRVRPPVASNLHIHEHLKACGVGGRSEIYDFTPPHIIQEHHQVFDVTSLFPFAAMAGHMPAGELCPVSQEGEPISQDLADSYQSTACTIQQVPLPVPNKLGFYYCTITSQPEFPVIPCKEKGHSLDWKRRTAFSRWVHVVLIRLHVYMGGTIRLHYGYVWDEMNDHYFDNSSRAWKAGKMRQDVLKGMLPTVSDEDPSVDEAKLEVMLAKRDPKVAWAVTAEGVNREKVNEVLAEYNPMVRWLFKMESNSMLGKTAKKLKEHDTIILNGTAAVQKFIEDHQTDGFVVHELSKNVDPNPSVMTQLLTPKSKCSMVTLEVNPDELFVPTKNKDSTKVPEACVSVTMFAYTHFHMALAIDRFYKAKAVRGVETDGIHGNQMQYIEWCRAQGITNPFWIDSPLLNIQPGSILDDAVFKPTPGNAQSQREMPLLGSFYCPSAANRYASEHKLPPVPRAADYGYFTEELRDQGLYDVYYPFCKFYYYRCHATGAEMIKAKGLSTGKKSPTRNGHDYLLMEHSKEYKDAGDFRQHKTKTTEQMRMLQAVLNKSKPAVDREMFEMLGKGIGIDAVDYRFQGRLSKINGVHISTEDLTPANHGPTTPIHYTMCTKRIEPHRYFRVSEADGRYYRNGVELSYNAVKAASAAVLAAIEADDPIAKRGLTVELDGTPAYLANGVIRRILNSLKKKPNGRDKGSQAQGAATDTSAATC